MRESRHDSRKRARAAEVATARRPFLYLFLGFFSVIAAWGYFASVEASLIQPWTTDFMRLHLASTQMLAGQDPYSAPLAEARYLESVIGGTPLTTGRHATLESPAVLMLLAPFTKLDPAVGYLIWSLVSALAAVASVLLLEVRLGPLHSDANLQGGPHRFCIIMTAVLFFYPTWITMVIGQTGLITLLLLVLGWSWARRGHDEPAGFAIGGAVALMPSLCLLAFYFLAMRRPRILAAALLAALFGLFVPAILIDFSILEGYFSALGAVNWFGAGWNASLIGFLAPLFGNSANPAPLNAPWATALVLAGASVICLRAIWMLGRRAGSLDPSQNPKQARRHFDLGFAFCLPLTLLLAPLGWLHSFVLLIPAFALALEACARRPRDWRWRERILLAWMLAAAPYPVLRAEENTGLWHWFGYPSFDTYALVILALTLWGLSQREAAALERHAARVESAKASGQKAQVAPVAPKPSAEPVHF